MIGADVVVWANGLSRTYQSGATTVAALSDVSLRLAPGEFVALRGRSGSGKTTLLNILAGLDDPTAGQVVVLGTDLATLNEAGRAKLRREQVGMLFQNAHLFPALTAQENVEIPLRLSRAAPALRSQRAREVLEMVGLGPRRDHRGAELSGGEQQRVALARALIHAPRLVLADEPTGNLDSMTARTITALLQQIAHDAGIAFLVATHDPLVVQTADRVLRLEDGHIAAE
jgi:ABC-type lipoprotein export system ATPase subunit